MVLRLQPCTAVSGQACQVWGGRECGVYVSEKEVVGTSGPGRVDKLDVAVVGGVL